LRRICAPLAGGRYFNAELLQVEHRISCPAPGARLSTTTKPLDRLSTRRRGSAEPSSDTLAVPARPQWGQRSVIVQVSNAAIVQGQLATFGGWSIFCGIASSRRASLGRHGCSCPQYGHRAMLIVSGIRLKVASSILTPVAKPRSVIGHRNINTPMGSSLCGNLHCPPRVPERIGR
jgi:uncharacterized Zn-binding protein involved in type VI secretion